jgi:hypothetical protein
VHSVRFQAKAKETRLEEFAAASESVLFLHLHATLRKFQIQVIDVSRKHIWVRPYRGTKAIKSELYNV